MNINMNTKQYPGIWGTYKDQIKIALSNVAIQEGKESIEYVVAIKPKESVCFVFIRTTEENVIVCNYDLDKIINNPGGVWKYSYHNIIEHD